MAMPDDINLGPYKPDAPPAQQFRNPVHCAMLSHDNLVYVCDRSNDRLQVFHPDGTFVKEVFIAKGHARRWFGVRHGVFERCAAEVFISGGWERT
jgi:6-phosphogluconolactonase (cycloisomerase 2 family)